MGGGREGEIIVIITVGVTFTVVDTLIIMMHVDDVGVCIGVGIVGAGVVAIVIIIVVDSSSIMIVMMMMILQSRSRW